MTQLNPKDLDDLLTPRETPEPPAGLAESIKAEIPAELATSTERREQAVPRSWLVAASVLVALGGAWLGYRAFEAPQLVSDAAAPAAQEPPARAAEAMSETLERQEQIAKELELAAEQLAGVPDAVVEEVESAVSELRIDGRVGDRQRLAESVATPQGDALNASSEKKRVVPLPDPTPDAEPETMVFRLDESSVRFGAELDQAASATSSAPAEPMSKNAKAADDSSRGPVGGLASTPEPAREQPTDRINVGGNESGQPAIFVKEHDYEAIVIEPPANRRLEPSPPPPPARPSPARPGRRVPPSKALGYVGAAEEAAGAGRDRGRSEIPKPQPVDEEASRTDAMYFEHTGVNPFVDPEDDPLSTFGLDVDTASYNVVRRYLSDGNLPPTAAVRVEELVNAFDYGDPVPLGGEGDFAVTVEGAPTPFTEGPRHRLLRFGIQGRVVEASERKPATLVFVVDISGSMARENRLELVKRALDLLLSELDDGDRVGLVVYGSAGRVVLEPTGDLWAIRRALAELSPEGSTNAAEGLLLGYQLASQHLARSSITRVILCSDGVANVGRTGPDAILDLIGNMADQGVELTTVGFGMGNYNDVLMERLANRGNGRYAYVDRLDEARRLFVEDLTGQLQTIAAEAKAQVEFDPRAVARYRLLGYENRDIADARFRDDTVDAGEIGAGHAVTALYEVELAENPPRSRPIATLNLRWASEQAAEVVETSHRVWASDIAPSWADASRSLRRAALVAELAELLKGTFWARKGSFEALAREAQAELGSESDERWRELARLVLTARALRP